MKLLLIALAAASFAGATLQAADAVKPEATATAYPLKTCVVTGEELGSMGKPYRHLHEGKEVQFCCKSCLPKFKKDPAKYLKKLEEAPAAKQS
jgi:YHS domain-containing protein